MIGGTYEYLMSSLPELSLQKKNEAKSKVLDLFKKYEGPAAEQLSVIQILNNEAKKFLPDSDYLIFEDLSLNHLHNEKFRKSNRRVVSAFSDFMLQLKSNVKEWRLAKRKNLKISPGNNIEKLIGQGSPLDKEVNIINYQWQSLEDIAAGEFADIESVFAYKIKLLLLVRLWSFDQKRGISKFKKLTTTH